MQQAFLEINGVRTNVLTYGRWVEESPESASEDIILVIPGNPGLTGFYKMFLHTLHEQTGFPAWTLSHAGHEVPKNNLIAPVQPWSGNEHLFGLKGQVQHKIDFIKRYVPEKARLHLVGHSIGSYMALELLHNAEINAHVSSISLLFPTIEHMAATTNGKFLNNLVRPIVWLVLFLAMIYTCLPGVIRNFLTAVYMWVAGVPKMHFKNLVQLVNPHVLKKVFSLAWEELDLIHDKNVEILRRNENRLRLMYGRSDGWTCKAFYEGIRRDFPGARAEMTDFHHSFVLKESRPVASVVANWVKAA